MENNNENVKTPETFKDRLLNEKAQLDERWGKLDEFLDSEKVNDIDPIQLSLLKIQRGAMQTYSQCLWERISRL